MVNRLAYRPTSQAPAHPSCGAVVGGGPHPLVRCSDLRREQEPMEERGRLKKKAYARSEPASHHQGFPNRRFAPNRRPPVPVYRIDLTGYQ